MSDGVVKGVIEDLEELAKGTAQQAADLPGNLAKGTVEQATGQQKQMTEEEMKKKEEERLKEIARIQRNLELMKPPATGLEKKPENLPASAPNEKIEIPPQDLPLAVEQKRKKVESKDFGGKG